MNTYTVLTVVAGTRRPNQPLTNQLSRSLGTSPPQTGFVRHTFLKSTEPVLIRVNNYTYKKQTKYRGCMLVHFLLINPFRIDISSCCHNNCLMKTLLLRQSPLGLTFVLVNSITPFFPRGAVLSGGPINPFTAPAYKISGLKDARTHLRNSLFSSPVTSFSVMRLGENLLRSQCEKEKRLKDFKCCTFIGRFEVTSWQWRG